MAFAPMPATFGLCALPGALAAAQRFPRLQRQRAHRDAEGRRCRRGQAGARGIARGPVAPGHRRMVARAALARAQASRRRRCDDGLPSGARAARRPIPITAPTLTSWPAGLRCAFSAIRRPRSRILPISTTARPIRWSSRAPPTGAAVRPRHWVKRTRCAPNTRLPPAIRPPTMASSPRAAWHR